MNEHRVVPPLTPFAVGILCYVFLAAPALGNREMQELAPPSGKDLLLSCRECGQKKALSCQLFQSLLYLQRATLRKVMPYSGSHDLIEEDIK